MVEIKLRVVVVQALKIKLDTENRQSRCGVRIADKSNESLRNLKDAGIRGIDVVVFNIKCVPYAPFIVQNDVRK